MTLFITALYYYVRVMSAENDKCAWCKRLGIIYKQTNG